MKLIRINCRQQTLAGIVMLAMGWIMIPQSTLAELPSGRWRIEVTDPTNHVWDITRIDELQEPTVEISDEDVFVSFDAPFSQSGAGKLAGAGPAEFDVMSPIYNGSVPGTYVAKGKISSAKGVATLTFSTSVKGSTMIEDRLHVLSSSFAVKTAVDSITESVTGSYVSAAAASGYGAVKETGTIDFSWSDVIAAMGDGRWTLHMNLTNDAVKKVGGSASVVLSGGRSLDFTVKGTYKTQTDSTLLIFSADAESKGSSLKVTLSGTGSAALQGKLTGQTIRAVATAVPE